MPEVQFSDKYQPLFDLLEAWNVINDPAFTDIYSTDEQKYWQDLSQVDTVLISGGRDSGKSFALSTFNCLAASFYNHRILYTRQTMSSTDNSITEALEKRMLELGVGSKFEAANKTYSKIDGTGKISISGQKTSVGTQTAKLKSLEDYSIFETDEGEELESYEDWEKIDRSMRAQDVQAFSLICFNPPTKAHWLYNQWYANIPEGFNGIKNNILYIHTTYIDNGKENMAVKNWNKYEALRLDYERYKALSKADRELNPKLKKRYENYKYTILGGFKALADGVIFEDWELGEFNGTLSSKCFGLDFGSQDPDTLVKVAIDWKNMNIYVREELYKNNLGPTELYEILLNRCGRNNLIVADPNERRMRKTLQIRGLNVVKARKKAGSVLSTIKTLKDFTLIIDPSSKNCIEALNNYVWHDKRAEVPRNEFKHFPDAIGYAVMELVVARGY